MVDQSAAQTAGPAHCPWCSAELPAEAVERCPSCDATLVGETETAAALPGVTAIDAEAIVRNSRMPSSPRRSRLLSWLGGEDTVPDEPPAPPGSLAPPPLEVRREILRLELEADIANLQAEADSITAEAAVEAEEEGTQPPVAQPETNGAEARVDGESTEDSTPPPPEASDEPTEGTTTPA